MSRTITIGMMQGRLSDKDGSPLQSFPWNSWKDEFSRAAEIGMDCIEWLLGGERDIDNPIASQKGRNEIKSLSDRYGVHVRSLCAHTFIDGALLDDGRNGIGAKKHFSRVMDWAWSAGVKTVVLPAMEAMSLKTNHARERFKTVLNEVLTSVGPELLLESDLSATDLSAFIDDVGSERLGVLYDIGNANAMGFNIETELKLLAPLLRELHIKDRDKENGPSRRLGEGSTPFVLAAKTLARLSWKGPVVMETPTFDDWQEEAKHNTHFTKQWCEDMEKLA